LDEETPSADKEGLGQDSRDSKVAKPSKLETFLMEKCQISDISDVVDRFGAMSVDVRTTDAEQRLGDYASDY
jgi:hypothetical protein